MTDALENSTPFQVECATLPDVRSLSTIVPRAFFPTSQFHRQAWPDTPIIRSWWSRIFKSGINDTDCHVIVALDPNSQDDMRVIGFLIMRLLEADDRTAGLLSLYEFTGDHDEALLLPAKEAWVQGRSTVFAGTGQKHYLLELLGVDYACKGQGLGKRMVRKACDIADRAGHPIFVEANGAAAGFYLQSGFEFVGENESSPSKDEQDHKTCRLVRPAPT